MITLFICYVAGILTPFALWIGHNIICDLVDYIRFKWNEPKKGTWMIHSYTNGADYNNGGRYAIYRYGFGHTERGVWSPPMRTEEEALAECARRNTAFSGEEQK